MCYVRCQENDVILVHEKDVVLIQQLCARERCPHCVVGRVTGDGRIVVVDEEADEAEPAQRTPVDLPLDKACPPHGIGLGLD